MKFPTKYKALNTNIYFKEEYSIVPIRFEDRYDIMKWRNEQMYHLRQAIPLTKEAQDHYFDKVVSELFEKEQPNQILFSYLKNDDCVGYGGLVHINWIDKNAEISFIIKTELEKVEFSKHWRVYLGLIENIAFRELKLHKIYTYAFDLRQQLYAVLEECNYTKEAVFKEHCFLNNNFLDVLIHSKFIEPISIRKLNYSDLNFTYLLSNDPLTRTNSFHPSTISFEAHEKWFNEKLKDDNALYFIGQFNSQPAAFIRIDVFEDENIIGITLNREYRGKGISSKFIKQTLEGFKQLYPNRIVTAYIKNDNIPSIKAFEKAGFKFVGSGRTENCSSKKYTT